MRYFDAYASNSVSCRVGTLLNKTLERPGEADLQHPTPRDLSLGLAWEFEEVLSGDFMRDRPSVREKRFPVLGPRPNGPTTKPKENAEAPGPYIYFVFAVSGEIKYIGKADERTVLYRWIRPDARTGLHQWSHGTNSATKKATVEFIADEIRAGRAPVRLYFSNAIALRASLAKRSAALGIAPDEVQALPSAEFIDRLEHYLIHALRPEWNIQRKSAPPAGPITRCGDFWNGPQSSAL